MTLEHQKQPPIKVFLKILKRLFAEAPQDQPTTLAATSYLSRNKSLIFWTFVKCILLWLLTKAGTLHSLYDLLLQRMPAIDRYPDLYFVGFLLLLLLNVRNLTRNSTRRVVNFFWCLLSLLGFALLYHTGQILTEIVGVILMITGILGSSYQAPIVYQKVEDKLHRLHFANRIAETITNSSEPIKRIAILGEWGSGKSHTLQLIERCLRERPEHSYGFSIARPWNVANEEELHTVIARAIEEAAGFNTNYKPFSWLKNLLNKFGKYAGETSEFVIDLVDYLNGSDTGAEVAELIQRLNDRIKASNKTLVIFIEDMERSEPEVVRRSFAMMDILAKFENCHFIFALDQTRIVDAFGGNKEVAKGFLDKVIDIQIKLATITRLDLISWCRSKFNETTAPNLLRVWDTISTYLPNTPRLAFRFIEMAKMMENAFLYRFTKDESTIRSFYALKLLSLQYPEAHNQLDSRILADVSYLSISSQEIETLRAQLSEKHPEIKFPDENAFQLLLMASGFYADHDWLLRDHTSLYALSEKEFDSIYKGFLSQPSKCLKQRILEFPDFKLLEDISAPVQDFFDRVFHILRTIKNADAALKIVNGLNQNFAISSTQEFLTPNRSKTIFRSWIAVILDRVDDDSSDTLVQSQLEYTRKLALKMSSIDLYLTLLFPYNFEVGDESSRERFIHHFSIIQPSLQERIYDDLIKAIRGNKVKHPLLDRGSGVASIKRYDIFCYLETWNPASDNFAQLRSLLDLSPEENYQHIWELMGEVANQLLNDFRNHLKNSPSARINLDFIRDNPEYFNIIWAMALKSNNSNIRGNHRACIKLMEEQPLDDAAIQAFTTAFPLEDGPSPT